MPSIADMIGEVNRALLNEVILEVALADAKALIKTMVTVRAALAADH